MLLLVALSLAFGLPGAWSVFFVNTLLMGAPAIPSGPLLLHQFRKFPNEERERGEWAGALLRDGVLHRPVHLRDIARVPGRARLTREPGEGGTRGKKWVRLTAGRDRGKIRRAC